MKKYFAVIDTNVLVSALLKAESAPASVLEFCFGGVIKPLYDDRILLEYREVLSRSKFNFDKVIIDTTIEALIEGGVRIEALAVDVEMPDPKDRVFYEVVMESRKNAQEDEDSYLVTGNIIHFPKETFVVTPREMLDIIVKDNN